MFKGLRQIVNHSFLPALALAGVLTTHAYGAAQPKTLTMPTATGTNRAKADAVIRSIARFKIYSDSTLALPSSTQLPPQQLLSALNARFVAMRQMVLAERDVRTARYGASVTLRTLKQLGRGDLVAQWAPTFLAKKYVTCDNFTHCSTLIEDFSSLADLAPQAVREATGQKLGDRIANLTYQLSRKNAEPYNNSLTQRVLQYRLESLRILCDFYALTGNGSEAVIGRTPRLSARSLAATQDRLTQLQSDYQSLLPPRKASTETADQYEHRTEQAYYLISQGIANDFRDFQKVRKSDQSILLALGADVVTALSQTRLGNDSLELYLGRLNHADLGPWLASIQTRINQGDLDPAIALMMGFRFSEAESYLPFRRDWLQTMHFSATKVGSATTDWKSLLSSVSILVDLRERQMRKYVVAQGLLVNGVDMRSSSASKSFGMRLLHDEKAIASAFPSFESLHYQSSFLTDAQNKLTQAAMDFRDAPADVAEGAREDLQQSLEASHDTAVEKWINLACYADWSAPRAQRDYQDLKIFFSDGGTYRVADACGRIKVEGPEGQTIQYMESQRLGKVWKPFKIQLAIAIATIPITLASAGLSAAAAAPVEAAAVDIGVGLATKYAVSRISALILTRMLPKVASAMVGSVVFTATQKTLLYAATLGQVPIYDRHLSFTQNYGKDLIFGSALFFFLPYSEGLSQPLLTKIAQSPYLANRPFLKDLSRLGIASGKDLVVFTSLPYIQRIIEVLVLHSKDPVIRGWGDFRSNVASSAATALAFHVRGEVRH